MHTQLGLAHFWSQGDFVTHAISLALLLLSVASWMIILRKGLEQWQAGRSHDQAMTAFWSAATLPEAIEALKAEDKAGIYSRLAFSGASAAQAHEQNADRGIGAGVNVSEAVTRALRSQIVKSQTGIEAGLTFLASVGSTAPFIGLFGTVWGIYHALVGLSGATTVVLDKVAGPVGEALIMTAAGLFVAIPAVLAYNAFTRANRITLALLDGFAHDLHAYLTTGTRATGLQLVGTARRA
jgi:biopolymer transport protein ExbB